MTLMDDLWDMWKQYIDYLIVGNEHLKKVMFHVFLGIVLTHKDYGYAESARKKSLRLHTFIIQDSGTGKSEMLKATHELTEHLGIKCRYSAPKDNEPSLSGTIRMHPKTGEIKQIKGLLHNNFAIFWDEGAVLLKPSRDMDVLQDRFQVVMDEPGLVSKGMALGELVYKTPATVVAGSYMFDEFRQTLLSKGFLQRMYICYKEFSPQEKEDMRRGVELLKANTKTEIVKKARDAMKVLTSKIPDLDDGLITFRRGDVLRFYQDMENVYQTNIRGQFTGEKQKILETFHNRFHNIIDKIASQRAIVLGKKNVEYEDMKYALNISDIHLSSLSEIFEYLRSEKSISAKEDREDVIIRELRRLGGFANQTQLLSEIRKLNNVGKWDLGVIKTMKLINDMVLKNKIYVCKGEKNAKILSLDEISEKLKE